MRKRFKGLLAACVAVLLTITSSLGVYAKEYTEEEKAFYAYYLNGVIEMLERHYKFDYPKDEIYQSVITRLMEENPELLEELIGIVVDSLDENSMYFTQDELSGFINQTEGSYVGIGVTVERKGGYVTITAITPNSPAQEAGLMPEDQIASIDGEDAKNFDIAMAQERIQGDAGTSVTLGILRNGEYQEFHLVRAAVDASPIAYSVTEDNIGVLVLSQFNDTAVTDTAKALASFDAQGIKDIVVDLRNNPGGYLSSVTSILSMFVPKGLPLIQVDFTNDLRDQTYYSTATFTEPKYNLAVLVNGYTASAAEVFTGAIMDNNLGIIIGETTYGKATIQEFMQLINYGDMNLGDIKLTVGEYLTPSGNNIHHRGIAPHLKVKYTYEPIDESTLTPFTYSEKYQLGDTGPGVLAIKERLSLFGYEVGEINDVYDEELVVAVTTFQRNAGLYPYGVMDITTQTFLESQIQTYERVIDTPFDTAIQMLKSPEEMKTIIETPPTPRDES